MKTPNIRFTSLLAGLILIPTSIEHLYLDPGSGSFILQLIIAGATGAVFIMRNQIARFFGIFRKKKGEKKPRSKKVRSRNAK